MEAAGPDMEAAMAATALEGVPPPSARPSVVPSFDVGCRSLSLALSLPPSLPPSLSQDQRLHTVARFG